MRDHIKSSTKSIIIDSKFSVERAKDFLVNYESNLDIGFHDNNSNQNILEKYGIKNAIQKALQPRVDLPSGGYIIIEPTEALTVIDVNSGSFTRSANSRQTVLWTNCEAAVEISRQMKLRNIGGVIVVDFIDMESRRDQFQLLEHFTSAIKDDSARPQIAQLTELGLVELTRKRQGQNIYELFGKKCSNCNGTGYEENQFNHDFSQLIVQNIEEKPIKSNSLKLADINSPQLTDKHEKITDNEDINPNNPNKEDSFNKKQNDNDVLNSSNVKEKNIITVDLTSDEKVVFSQLGINPLIKLGKEYLTSNNFVRINKDGMEKERTLDNKKNKKQVKKISKFKEAKEIDINIEENINSNDKSRKKTNNNNQEVVFLDKKDEIELTDDINNARKKRRRSSASSE